MNRYLFAMIGCLCFAVSACHRSPCAVPTAVALGATNVDLQTDFEESGGTRTPRYAQTIAYCQKLDAASPLIAYTTFGQSPQGRELPLLIVDSHGNFTPEAVRKSNNVVLLVEAGLHAGEIEGKDAGFMLLRNIAQNKEIAALLDHVTLLFIPIFNVDGHERFGPYNRINQNGPVEMGWRTTARNLNLNRDFVKADTVEMQAWLKLFNTWLPDFFIDIHSTDGADYQYSLTYGLPIFGEMDPALTAWTKDYERRIKALMTANKVPIFPYVSYKNWHDPRSGLEAYAASPRFSTGYTAVQNRPAMLIETHMLKDYATRVHATREMLKQTLAVLHEQGRALKDAIARADARAASPQFRLTALSVDFEATEKSEMVDFLGKEYEVVKSDLSGGDWFKYSDKPVTFSIPYYNDLQPSLKLTLPVAYLIPAEWDDVIERLALHGVAFSRLAKEVTIKVRSYRFKNVEFGSAGGPNHRSGPYEGRLLCQFDLESIEEVRTFLPGTVVVHTAQRAARIIGHLLEPVGPDSFMHWGFFNTIFQQTEYAESYVMEAKAREMLAKDPALAATFAAEKEKLAGDSRAILDWFYRQTPYFDQQLNRYPVGLVTDSSTWDAQIAPALSK